MPKGSAVVSGQRSQSKVVVTNIIGSVSEIEIYIGCYDSEAIYKSNSFL
jgi:hypothetical protein